MKYLALIVFGLMMTACMGGSDGEKATETMEALDEMSFDDLVDIDQADPTAPLELASDGGTIILDSFQERQLIESPLVLTGTAPRSWFFEGNFPVTLMTLEEDIIREWYAEGPWLDAVDGNEDLGADDRIPFTANIEFAAPEGGDMGKIRFSKNVVADEDVEASVETMILWP